MPPGAGAAGLDLEIHFSDGDPASHRAESHGNFHRLGYVPYARDVARYAPEAPIGERVAQRARAPRTAGVGVGGG